MEVNKKDIFVIGHKNPDTDSIGSAIAYATLKNQISEEYNFIACRSGDVNSETKFVLEYFGVEAPELLTNAAVQIKDLPLTEVEPINENSDLKQVYAMMKQRNIAALPVVDGGVLHGIITNSDIAVCKEDAVYGVSMCFNEKQKVSEIRSAVEDMNYNLFPVIDEQGKYLGMVTKDEILNASAKRLILVDHNEKTQSVEGVEEAEIIEIIDHHRIGSLETVQPIYFRNQPLGCAATIVAQMYKEYDVEMPKHIAGLLCSAILSDTLMYRSPTCTPIDTRIAEELAEKAGINVESYAEEMFTAGSNVADLSAEQIFYQDFKIFRQPEGSFGIGQVSAMNNSITAEIKAKVMPYLETAMQEKDVDMVFLMLTNIVDESSELIFFGERAEEVLEKGFGVKKEGDSFLLPGVISRKKQFLPGVLSAL